VKRDKPLTTIRMRAERDRVRGEKSDERRAWQGERGKRGQVDVYLHVSKKRGALRRRV